MESLNKTIVRAIMPINDQNNRNSFQNIDPKFVRLSGIALAS